MPCRKLGGIGSGDAAGFCTDPDGQWWLWVFQICLNHMLIHSWWNRRTKLLVVACVQPKCLTTWSYRIETSSIPKARSLCSDVRRSITDQNMPDDYCKFGELIWKVFAWLSDQESMFLSNWLVSPKFVILWGYLSFWQFHFGKSGQEGIQSIYASNVSLLDTRLGLDYFYKKY